MPIIALALSGTLINPAFAAEIGWPPLAERNGPVMLVIAVGINPRNGLGDLRGIPARRGALPVLTRPPASGRPSDGGRQ